MEIGSNHNATPSKGNINYFMTKISNGQQNRQGFYVNISTHNCLHSGKPEGGHSARTVASHSEEPRQ
jgi:hypothetical protein